MTERLVLCGKRSSFLQAWRLGLRVGHSGFLEKFWISRKKAGATQGGGQARVSGPELGREDLTAAQSPPRGGQVLERHRDARVVQQPRRGQDGQATQGHSSPWSWA
jgi:hypothetical protein